MAEIGNRNEKHWENLLNQALERAQDCEKKLSLLAKTTSDGVFILEGIRFRYANPSFCNITGYSQEELTSSNFVFTDLLSHKTRQLVEEQFLGPNPSEFFSNRYEIELITKDGQRRTAEVCSEVREEGEEMQIMGVVRDVTEHRAMEREVSKKTRFQAFLVKLAMQFINPSQQDYDKLINGALAEIGTFFGIDRSYVFSYNFQNQTTSCTYEWCSQGTPSEKNRMQNIPFALDPSWNQSHAQNAIRVVTNVEDMADSEGMKGVLMDLGEKTVVTMPMFHQKKQLGFVGFNSNKEFKEWSPSELSLLELFTNLLVNFQAKAELERTLRDFKIEDEINQIRLRHIVDFSPVGILLISPSGYVLDVNKSALTMLGSPSAEATKKLNLFTTKSIVDVGFSSDLLQCIETKTSIYRETRYASVWGKVIFIKYHLVPVVIGGTVKNVLANFEDITEAKEVEVRLIQLKEKAEESDRLKSAFLANMSHEIRTPMNAICGLSNLMLSNSYDPEQFNSFIEIINLNSHQLLSIINDIIDISKLEAGQVTVNTRPFSLGKLLNEIHTQFSQLSKLAHQDVEFNVIVPDWDITVVCDETKLKQIIGNLIYNAIKFTEKGQIDFGFRSSKTFIEFFVRDTGIGIHPDKFGQIFDRFQQIEDSELTKTHKGTGLGLPIAKAYVELLGGEIWLTSQLGMGSTFFFTLPNKQTQGQNEDLVNLKIGEFDCEDKTILVAEDDPANFFFLNELLVFTKAKIIHAKNGLEAIELCNTYPVDLILMDIKMPKLNGFESATALRRNGFSKPIVAQTAYAFLNDRAKALECGFNDFIIKPIDKKELFTILKKWLEC